MRIYSIRGATTIDKDCASEIKAESIKLLREMLEKNSIASADLVNLIISTTYDIKSEYPAKCVRESGLLNTVLFSTAEPQIDGALAKCIRMMLTIQKEGEFSPKHIYLNGAKVLRPDLLN